MALPTPPTGYVASTEEVARKVGLDPDALTDDQETAILDAILDAQSQVQAFLNRESLFQTARSITDQYPDTTYELTDWHAWPDVLAAVDDDFTVVSSAIQADGWYTVSVLTGIDARTITPIRRWIVRTAAEQLRSDPDSAIGTRRVSSLSAEGQSISYEKGSEAQGTPGNVPPLDSLARWRRPVIYRRTTVSAGAWPYQGPYTLRT